MLNKAAMIAAGLSIGACVAGVVLAHGEWIRPTAGLALFALGGLMGLLSVGLAVAVMFITQSWPAAMIGLLGALPFVALMGNAADVLRHPRINDVSTDLERIPEFRHAPTLPDNAGRDMAMPPDFVPLIREHYPKLRPLPLSDDPDTAYVRALGVAKTRMPGWTVTAEDAAGRTFEGIAETRVFRWRDDFVVRVEAGDAGGSVVHMRSKSRDGKSDLGANARRIAQYFRVLDGGR